MEHGIIDANNSGPIRWKSVSKMEERSLKDLFHMVKQVLPEPQELVTFSPEKTISEALAFMLKHNFSQVPVITGNKVLGTFSYRSFRPIRQ